MPKGENSIDYPRRMYMTFLDVKWVENYSSNNKIAAKEGQKGDV